MSFKYILDSSVWVLYFNGTITELKDIVERGLCATSVIAVAELSDKFARDGIDFMPFFSFMQAHASFLPLDISIALAAGKIKKKYRAHHPKFGLVDALHLATAQHAGTIFVTSDRDFHGIEGVSII